MVSSLGTPDLLMGKWLGCSSTVTDGLCHAAQDSPMQGLLPALCIAHSFSGRTNDHNNKTPGSCLWRAYIVGDALHHQPIRKGHVIQTPLPWPMGNPQFNGVTQLQDSNGGQSGGPSYHYLIWLVII